MVGGGCRLSIYLSFYLSIYLSFYLSIYLRVQGVCRVVGGGVGGRGGGVGGRGGGPNSKPLRGLL